MTGSDAAAPNTQTQGNVKNQEVEVEDNVVLAVPAPIKATTYVHHPFQGISGNNKALWVLTIFGRTALFVMTDLPAVIGSVIVTVSVAGLGSFPPSWAVLGELKYALVGRQILGQFTMRRLNVKDVISLIILKSITLFMQTHPVTQPKAIYYSPER